MVKRTQTIRRQQPTNCLNVFDHFWWLVLKGLMTLCCYYGQIPECEESISPSKFDGQLPDILVKCLCPPFLVNVSKIFLFLLFVRSWCCCCDWITMCEGNIVCLCSYFRVNGVRFDQKNLLKMGLLTGKEVILVYHPKCLNGVSVTRQNLTVRIRVRTSVGVTLLTLFLLGWYKGWYRNLFSHCVGRNCNLLLLHW